MHRPGGKAAGLVRNELLKWRWRRGQDPQQAAARNNDSNDAKDDYAPTRHHALCRPCSGRQSPNSDDPVKSWSATWEEPTTFFRLCRRQGGFQTQWGTRWMSPWEQNPGRGWPGAARPSTSICGRAVGGEYPRCLSQRRPGPSACSNRVATAGPINGRGRLPSAPQTAQQRGPIPPCSLTAAAGTGSPYHWRSGHTAAHELGFAQDLAQRLRVGGDLVTAPLHSVLWPMAMTSSTVNVSG